ncbi:hypothetical protein KR018_008084, partial [Drosophila ironensis]
WFVAGGFVLFWAILFLGVVVPLFYRLPEAKTLEDAHLGGFVAERAYENLRVFDAIGPKMVGFDNNENKTHNFILRELAAIQANVNPNIVTMEVEEQVTNGTFVRNDLIYMYQGLQNIIVKLTPIGNTNENWILINTHTDSKPTSNSAADAGHMVTVAMEVIRVLTTVPKKLGTTIIILFNGGEEITMRASHGFMTQHRWAPYCKVLINLDSAGSGGKELLFQAGPKDYPVALAYKQLAEHPFATVVAEEIYSTNIVPSDTDVSVILGVFAKMRAYDFGLCVNGFVYHTRYDRVDIIPMASLQNTGENVLSLTIGLSQMDVSESTDTDSAVFFDFLGLFMITYPTATGTTLNYAAAVVVVVLIYISLLRIAAVAKITSDQVISVFVLILVVQVVAFVLGLALPIVVAYLFDEYGLTLSYFSTPALSLGLYVLPSLVGLVLPSYIYLKLQKIENISYVQQLQMLLHGQGVVLALICVALNYYGLRTTYVFAWSLIFYAIPVALNLLTTLHDRGWSWSVVVSVFQVVPFMYSSYLFYTLVVILTPMMGRFGQSTNPDLIISALAALGTILSMGFVILLINMSRRSGIIIVIMLALSAATIYVASSTQIGYPYRARTNVQRLYYLQTARFFYEFDGTLSKNDSGYLFSLQDRLGAAPLTKAGVDLSGMVSVGSLCTSFGLCTFALPDWRYYKSRLNLNWMPRDKPIETWIKPPMKVVNRTLIDDGKSLQLDIRFYFTEASTLSVQPLADVTLTNWTLPSSYLSMTPPYIIFYAEGIIRDPVDLTFVLTKTNADYDMPSVILEVARQNMSSLGDSEAQAFAETLPAWTAPVTWPADYHQYTL